MGQPAEMYSLPQALRLSEMEHPECGDGRLVGYNLGGR